MGDKMTMVELMAEALLNRYRARKGRPAGLLSNMLPGHRQEWIEDATAALECLKEPTEGMLKAAAAVIEDLRHADWADSHHVARETLRAAINAALTEGTMT